MNIKSLSPSEKASIKAALEKANAICELIKAELSAIKNELSQFQNI